MDEDIKNALRIAKARKGREPKEKPMPKELESFYSSDEAGSRVRRGVLKPGDYAPDYGASVNKWREKRGAYGREDGYDPWSDKENVYTHPSEERHDPKDPKYYIDPEEYRKGIYGSGVFAIKNGGRVGMADGGDSASATKNFVTQAYENILGRKPDSEGLNFWTSLLTAGKIDPSGLVGQFRQQPQARERAASAVMDLYDESFGRSGDVAGVKYWTNQLLSGMPISEIQNAFSKTPEYKEYQSEKSQQIRDYISDEYRELMGREPDKAGLDYWTEQAENGMPITEISNALSNTEESQLYQASNFEPYQVAGKTVAKSGPNTLEINEKTDKLMRSQPLAVQLATLLVQEGEQYLSNLTPDNIKELASIGYTPFTRAAAEFKENPGIRPKKGRPGFFGGWFDTNDPRDPSSQILAPSAYSSMKSPASKEARRGLRIAEDVVNNPDSPINQAAMDIAQKIIKREIPNPTPGATNYLNPNVYKKQPRWTQTLADSKIGKASPIGKHIYYSNPIYDNKIKENFDLAFNYEPQEQYAGQKPYQDFTQQQIQQVESQLKQKPTPTSDLTLPATPTEPPKPAPGSGPFGGYASLNEYLDSLAPPPPPPPSNYQEAVAKYKQDYANWEDSVRRWQAVDAANNKGKVGPVPAMIMNNRPIPPNPADWGNPSGGIYSPEPPPPESKLQPINQGAGTQVNPPAPMPTPPPISNPSPTPMPGNPTWTPPSTITPITGGGIDAMNQNVLTGIAGPGAVAGPGAGINYGLPGGGGPGTGVPSGLPSITWSPAPVTPGFGVSLMNKGGVVEDALRIAKAKGGAWTRKEGKNPEGGLNEKGRASLRAQGHDIKRPQPEGGPRRDSFCARSAGQAKMFPEAAKDPNSRLNKARRKWNCADGGAIEDALRIAQSPNKPVRMHETLARTGYASGGKPIWDKSRPKSLGKPEPLSDKQKASAKAAAKAAGRPWPNMIDNLRAAQRKK